MISTLPSRRRRYVSFYGVVFTWALAIGCGGDGLPTYPASGRVAFPDGKPLPGGSVIFQCDEHGIAARAPIETDGTFELGTYAPGDGAVEGRHRVVVLPPGPQGDPDETRFVAAIDVKYQNAERSGLVFDVKAEGDNEFSITVEPPRIR